MCQYASVRTAIFHVYGKFSIKNLFCLRVLCKSAALTRRAQKYATIK